MRDLIIGLSFLLALPAFAEDVADTPPAMPAESSPTKVQGEPDIRVIEKDDATVTEFRLNGKLYQVKVVPKVGKPYYLIDPSGRGEFLRRDGPLDNIAVPTWVLLEF